MITSLTAQARAFYQSGKFSKGKEAARKAFRLSVMSIVLGIIFIIVIGAILTGRILLFTQELKNKRL